MKLEIIKTIIYAIAIISLGVFWYESSRPPTYELIERGEHVFLIDHKNHEILRYYRNIENGKNMGEGFTHLYGNPPPLPEGWTVESILGKKP